MGKPDLIHKVHVYGHGSTVENPHGPPFPSLPSSWVFSGPTCSGESQAWLSLILRVYKGMWDRIFVFSPSILVDDSYQELRKYLDKMSPREKLYFDDLDMNALGKIIADQTAIVECARKTSRNRLRYWSSSMIWPIVRTFLIEGLVPETEVHIL